jgi:hypothetical protein
MASLTEDPCNRVPVVGLQADGVAVEDDYGYYPDFVILVEVNRELRVISDGAEDGAPRDDGRFAVHV